MEKGRKRVAEASPRGAARGKTVSNAVRFYYERSPLMRTIHVDGIFGGVTPHGMIEILPFLETTRIPTSVAHQLSPDGRLGAELMDQRQIENTGIVRELEVRLVLNLDTAKSFKQWLEEKIKVLEALQTDKKKGTKPPNELQ